MISTKDLYMKACLESKDLHVLTDEERLRLQEHLRQMYLEIEKVCDRHNLRMCTGYGTVLGALRHQGFIPWDDDMDLLMPREDYNKLIHEYAHELPNNFAIYAPNSSNGPITRFAKVVDTNTRFLEPGAPDDKSHGIFIDIFPVENSISSIPLIKIKRMFAMLLMVIASSVSQYEAKNEVYKRLMCSSPDGKKTYNIRNFIGLVFSFKSVTSWFNALDNFLQHKTDTDVCCVPSGEAAYWRYYYPYTKSLYFPARKMKFDNIEVYVPAEAEHHCEIEYGDWHWIPPVDQRWQHFIKEIRF
jgi:lipopolysaccharide cholinephosphotransferase